MSAPPGKPATHRLSFPQLESEIATREDETLFQSARRQGVRIVGACGGRGTCGSCSVRVREGQVASAGEGGKGSAAHVKANAGAGPSAWQQACQISARADCVIEISPRSLARIVRAETDRGEKEILPLDAAVVALDLQVPEASLSDPLSDADRVLRALGSAQVSVDLGAARALPAVLRAHHHGKTWSLRAWRRGQELVGFGPPGHPTLGLAVDLGTTNTAAFLVDLETGERLATLGVENPQVAWGADVISRLNHAIRGPEASTELRVAAIEGINALAHDLCKSVGRLPADIVDLAVCGNTAMHHLLLGLPVRQLGRAPFVAAVREGMDLKARDLGLTVAPGASVHVAPNVGGFVGGDHVAALLATEEHWSGVATALVMDIGTNTEISVIRAGRIFSASAPSGPALEGGHISCGMRAAIGAIERVSCVDGRLKVRTIGRKKPIGLCGSGVLDTLAVMHASGLVNDQGRLATAHPDIVAIAGAAPGKRAAQLAPGVLFTQGDVRAVQLAKAAIRTAVEFLVEEAGVTAGAIERFVIAGSFGAYISVESGIAIGLFPALPTARFLQVGNAAGVGVRRMLASLGARARARDLARACQYVELSSRPEFQKVFMHHIGLPEPRASKVNPT